MSKIILFSFLGCVCFLYTLNLFLKGAKKQIIEAVLCILIVATVIASFFVLGWRWGLIAVISPFVLVGLFRPLTQAVAYILLGYRTGIDEQSESINSLPLFYFNGGEANYTGGDGLVPERAVIISGCSHVEGVAAEYAYITKIHGQQSIDWEAESQTLIGHGGKILDAIAVKTRNGGRTYYFDTSGFFGKFTNEKESC